MIIYTELKLEYFQVVLSSFTKINLRCCWKQFPLELHSRFKPNSRWRIIDINKPWKPLRIRVKQHIKYSSPIGAEKSLLDSGGFRVVVLGTYPNPKLWALPKDQSVST